MQMPVADTEQNVFQGESPGQFPFLGLPDVWEEEAESLSKHIQGRGTPSTVSFWQC